MCFTYPTVPPLPCHCLQIFEVYGLGRQVIDTAFAGTVSRIGGMSLADIQRETEAFWAKGFPDKVRGAVRLRWCKLYVVLCVAIGWGVWV